MSRRKIIKILLTALCVLVLSFIGCIVLIYTNIAKIWEKPVVDPNTIAAVEIDPEISGLPTNSGGNVKPIEQTEGTIDILLIGVDQRKSGDFTGLSDVMIILRIDKEKKQLKLASFMRDTFVPIEGHNKNKLNAAYSFGQIDLAEKTFQQNFGITPEHYIIVNFYGMEDIIDDLGGVDITVDKGEELEWLNININEINKEDPKHAVKNITKSGEHHLNGRQAVAYMRIRHPDFDSGRIERQQKVLTELFKKAKGIGLGELPGLIDSMVKYVKTDIGLGAMLDIANTIKSMEGTELKTFRYPEDYDNPTIKGAGSIVLPKDFDAEMKKLQDFLKD